MKFNTDNKPFKIDGTTTLTMTFEIGDIFININNKVKGIKNILKDKIEFIDEENNVSFESSPLSNEFTLRYRFAGTVNDDKLSIYEDSISLRDN